MGAEDRQLLANLFSFLTGSSIETPSMKSKNVSERCIRALMSCSWNEKRFTISIIAWKSGRLPARKCKNLKRCLRRRSITAAILVCALQSTIHLSAWWSIYKCLRRSLQMSADYMSCLMYKPCSYHREPFEQAYKRILQRWSAGMIEMTNLLENIYERMRLFRKQQIFRMVGKIWKYRKSRWKWATSRIRWNQAYIEWNDRSYACV